MDHFDALSTAVSGLDGIAVRSKKARHQFAEFGVIIDDQNPRGC
jgi:hypothetical protein